MLVLKNYSFKIGLANLELNVWLLQHDPLNYSTDDTATCF